MDNVRILNCHVGVLAFCLCFFLLAPVARVAAEGMGEPVIEASSAILVEASTGRVVYEKNADEVRPPASMTKMMTCILGLENMRPRTIITVSPHAAMTEDSALCLQPAEQVDAENLLLGMMTVSDNGAAVAVAEHVDGSVESFARRMNEKAKEIGCKDTTFQNPNGLPNDRHLSTARDMARIAAYCMRNQSFRDLVGRKTAVMRWESPKGKTLGMENTNELLGVYQGITGIKTGWTFAAGGCLAASAKRDGVELIAVVMHAPDTKVRFDDAATLLDYGFSGVKMQRVLSKERVSKRVWVKGGKEHQVNVGLASDVDYPLLHGEKAEEISVEYEMPRIIEAPVKKGQPVGCLILKHRGKEVGRMDLVARSDVPSGFSFLSYFFVGLLSYMMK